MLGEGKRNICAVPHLQSNAFTRLTPNKLFSISEPTCSGRAPRVANNTRFKVGFVVLNCEVAVDWLRWEAKDLDRPFLSVQRSSLVTVQNLHLEMLGSLYTSKPNVILGEEVENRLYGKSRIK